MSNSTASDWRDIRALFERAVGLQEPARAELLAASGCSAAVLGEVRSLLTYAAADTDTEAGFLALPAMPLLDLQARHADADQGTDNDRVGQRLGSWRITAALGAGGMGEVWRAERADGAYTGQVAIKLLKRGMDTAAVLQRFAQERQALARLSHPHIARLLDAGRSDDGLPFFVMELVEGRPIDEACAGLPVVARLRLFLQLADAVAFAHRNLLVHRDLKPGNVLVDGEGQVKLLDFGIAKALMADTDAGAAMTQIDQRPFTPHYASPEQVRGEPVGTATDVYSLGVLLYVMLTGQRPYGREAGSSLAAARAVLDEAPLRPSLALRQLEGELDTVLLKALEKPLDRRYASVDALAADVSAYISGYPVSARPSSPWYLARKFAARHRGVVALSVLAAASLIGGTVATRWQMQRADLARAAAERRFAEVRQFAKQLVFRYHDQIVSLPGAVGVRQALLDDAASYLDDLAADAAGDATLQRELAETYHRLSLLQGEMFSPSQERVAVALGNAEKASALAATLAGQPAADVAFVNTAVDMWLNRATIEARLGRLVRSVESLRQAGVLAEQARKRAPADPEVISRLATLQGRLALALGSTVSQASLGRVAEARGHWDQALALFEQLVQREPGRAEWVHQLAWAWVGQTNSALLAGQFDAAVLAGQRAVALRDRAAGMAPGNAHFAHQRAAARNNLATALSLTGEHALALRYQDEAVEYVMQTVRADPSNSSAQRDLALIGLARARPLQALGRQAEALAAVRAALLALPAAAIQPDDFYMARWRAEALVWAARLQRVSDPPAALVAARGAVAQLQGLAGEDHAARRWALASAHGELAQALQAGGQQAAAVDAAREALLLWGGNAPAYFATQQRRDLALAAPPP